VRRGIAGIGMGYGDCSPRTTDQQAGSNNADTCSKAQTRRNHDLAPNKNRYQPNLCHIVAYSSGDRACKVVHARDGRRQITIYDTEAQLYKIRQHDCFPADLTDIAGLGDVIERAAGALGRPDILVNSRIRPSPPCRD